MPSWSGRVRELQLDTTAARVVLERNEETRTLVLYSGDVGAAPSASELARRGALVAVCQRAFDPGAFITAYYDDPEHPVARVSLVHELGDNSDLPLALLMSPAELGDQHIQAPPVGGGGGAGGAGGGGGGL